jgi:hypothetical protein
MARLLVGKCRRPATFNAKRGRSAGFFVVGKGSVWAASTPSMTQRIAVVLQPTSNGD